MISEIMSLNRNYLFYQTINKYKWQTLAFRMDFGLRATFEKNVMIVLDKMVLSFHKWLLIKYYLNALVKSDILN